MLNRILLAAAAVLVPTLVLAADLPRVRRHHAPPRVERVAIPDNHAIRCSTTDLVIIAVASCGGGLGSLAFSGY